MFETLLNLGVKLMELYYIVFSVEKLRYSGLNSKCFTYIFGICILSASFCRPKSCQGRERVDPFVLVSTRDVVGLFWLPCTTVRCGMLFTETGMLPLASIRLPGWQSSV